MRKLVQGNLFPEIQGKKIAERPKDISYEEWLAKFETPKTTDECYTPRAVYNAVLEWLKERVDIEGREIIRPFIPGGDYERAEYPENCVVIDNPPFSIATKIVRFYSSRNIPFFLFAPGLTLFQTLRGVDACGVVCDVTIEYANKAKVHTGFVTNLFPGTRIKIAKSLKERLAAAQLRDYKSLPVLEFDEHLILRRD